MLNIRSFFSCALVLFVMFLMLLTCGNAFGAKGKNRHYRGVNVNSPVSMSIYGWLTFGGEIAPLGTEIAVFDSQEVLCGTAIVGEKEMGAFLMHVYGDDPTSPNKDEGLNTGEALRFEVYSPEMGTTLSGKSLLIEEVDGQTSGTVTLRFLDKSWYGIRVETGD